MIGWINSTNDNDFGPSLAYVDEYGNGWLYYPPCDNGDLDNLISRLVYCSDGWDSALDVDIPCGSVNVEDWHGISLTEAELIIESFTS